MLPDIVKTVESQRLIWYLFMIGYRILARKYFKHVSLEGRKKYAGS